MNIIYYQVYVLFDPYGDLTSKPTKEVLGNFKEKSNAIRLKEEWINKKKEYFKNGEKREDEVFHGKYTYWRGYDKDPIIEKKSINIK